MGAGGAGGRTGLQELSTTLKDLKDGRVWSEKGVWAWQRGVELGRGKHRLWIWGWTIKWQGGRTRKERYPSACASLPSSLLRSGQVRALV